MSNQGTRTPVYGPPTREDPLPGEPRSSTEVSLALTLRQHGEEGLEDGAGTSGEVSGDGLVVEGSVCEPDTSVGLVVLPVCLDFWVGNRLWYFVGSTEVTRPWDHPSVPSVDESTGERRPGLSLLNESESSLRLGPRLRSRGPECMPRGAPQNRYFQSRRVLRT